LIFICVDIETSSHHGIDRLSNKIGLERLVEGFQNEKKYQKQLVFGFLEGVTAPWFRCQDASKPTSFHTTATAMLPSFTVQSPLSKRQGYNWDGSK